ncbi:hypothetical protein BH09MYX1_BH09MYX1_00740 [soil metagenome]
MSSAEANGSAHFRLHGRKPVAIHAQVSHTTAGWERSLRVVDLALGGACLELMDDVAVGEALRVSFVTPDRWDPLVLKARVAWTQTGEDGVMKRGGVAFEHDDEESAVALLLLIGSHDFDE